MIKKFQPALYFFLVLIAFLGLNSCNVKNLTKAQSIDEITCDPSKYNIDYDKYRSAVTYNYSIDITTNDVIKKTTEIRAKLAEINGIDIESFSSNESNSNIRVYLPVKDASIVDKIFSSDREITSFNRSTSNIGSSYIDYAERYYTYKILLDNFQQVKEIVSKASCDKIDSSSVRRVLEDNIRSYESSMDSYQKQSNKVYLQIYIRKPGA